MTTLCLEIRCCENCRYAGRDLAGLSCNLIDEQRASVAHRGAVESTDFCDQHDFRGAA